MTSLLEVELRPHYLQVPPLALRLSVSAPAYRSEGARICEALSGAGYRVAVLDHDGAAAEKVSTTLANTVGFKFDITDEASVTEALRRFGAQIPLQNELAGAYANHETYSVNRFEDATCAMIRVELQAK